MVLSTEPVEYVMPLLQLGLRGSCQKVRRWRAKLPHFMHVSICRPWPFKALGLQDKRLRTAFKTFESCELRAFWVLQFALVRCANTSFAIVRTVDGWPCLLDH